MRFIVWDQVRHVVKPSLYDNVAPMLELRRKHTQGGVRGAPWAYGSRPPTHIFEQKLIVPLITLLMLLIMSCANDSIGQETPSKPVWHRMDGLPLSLEIYPIFSDMIVSEDGEKFPLAYRKPIGTGPFPVMLFFHGGVRSFSRSVVDDFLKNATTTRFLKKGYMVVASTRRELQWRKTENPSSYTAPGWSTMELPPYGRPKRYQEPTLKVS